MERNFVMGRQKRRMNVRPINSCSLCILDRGGLSKQSKCTLDLLETVPIFESAVVFVRALLSWNYLT
jgi:hypothetical protein